MDLTQDKLDLIATIIKKDKKFSNNEDLYDDFFNETCQRSFEVVNIVPSDALLRSYLQKVVNTSMLNVLKNSGRLRRAKKGFQPVREVPLASNNSTNNIEISYNHFYVENSPEEIVIKNDILKHIANAVIKADEEEPDKRYLRIYKLRYDKGLTQKEIADELSLSQAEVSKRLFKLMTKVKKSFN